VLLRYPPASVRSQFRAGKANTRLVFDDRWGDPCPVFRRALRELLLELNGEDVEELNGNETKVGVLSKRESLHSSGRRASSKVGRSGTLKLVVDKENVVLDPMSLRTQRRNRYLCRNQKENNIEYSWLQLARAVQANCKRVRIALRSKL
jgi:hypothetical protein